jgi:hypothetical protein
VKLTAVVVRATTEVDEDREEPAKPTAVSTIRSLIDGPAPVF